MAAPFLDGLRPAYRPNMQLPFSGTVTSLPAQRHQIFLTRLAHDGPARPAVCFVRHVRRHGPYVHMRGKPNSACVTLFSAAAYPHDSQPSEVCRGSTSI